MTTDEEGVYGDVGGPQGGAEVLCQHPLEQGQGRDEVRPSLQGCREQLQERGYLS